MSFITFALVFHIYSFHIFSSSVFSLLICSNIPPPSSEPQALADVVMSYSSSTETWSCLCSLMQTSCQSNSSDTGAITCLSFCPFLCFFSPFTLSPDSLWGICAVHFGYIYYGLGRWGGQRSEIQRIRGCNVSYTPSLWICGLHQQERKRESVCILSSHMNPMTCLSLCIQLHIQNVRCCGTTLTAGLVGGWFCVLPRKCPLFMIICYNNNDTLIFTEILFGLHTENCQSSIPDF